jgi:hypothetical protein
MMEPGNTPEKVKELLRPYRTEHEAECAEIQGDENDVERLQDNSRSCRTNSPSGRSR